MDCQPPYQNPASLKAHRMTYDQHVNKVVFQVDFSSYRRSRIHGPESNTRSTDPFL